MMATMTAFNEVVLVVLMLIGCRTVDAKGATNLTHIPPEYYTACKTNVSSTENGRIHFRDVCALDLSFIRWKILPQKGLTRFPRLINLTLVHTNITTILQGAFWGVPLLENLDLSYNQLKFLKLGAFEGLPSLIYLDLSHNQLRIWKARAFIGLTSLLSLNLRYNNLSRRTGTVYPNLPALRNLFLQGNKDLTLSPSFFINSTLRFIEMTSISKKCQQCNFTRIENKSSVLKYECQYVPEKYKSQFSKEFDEAIIFNGDCKRRRCRLDVTDFVSKAKSMRRNRCWETLQKLTPVEFSLGAMAVAFNTFLISVVLSNKQLRRSTTYLIAAHIALCDILRGLYAILLANGQNNASELGFSLWRKTYCPYYRSIFLLSEVMGIATCLLAVLERYLKIVHWNKPDLHLTPRVTLGALAVIWTCGVVFCVLIDVIDAVDTSDNKMCLLIRNMEKHSVFFVEITLFTLVTLCLMGIGLYVRIFLFASKSGQQLGIKRECRLVKKIGILLVSNVLFLLGPNLAMFVFIFESETDFTAVWDTVLRMWVPPMCLVVNSCLNPWYYCFRTDKFVSMLKKSPLWPCKSNSMAGKASKLQLRRNRVNIANSYEMMSSEVSNDNKLKLLAI